MDIEINKSDVSPALWQKLLTGCRLDTVTTIIADVNVFSYSQKIPDLKLQTVLQRKPNWSVDEIVAALPLHEDTIRKKLKQKPNWTAEQAIEALR